MSSTAVKRTTQAVRGHRRAGVAHGCHGARQIHQVHHLAAEHVAEVLMGFEVVGAKLDDPQKQAQGLPGLITFLSFSTSFVMIAFTPHLRNFSAMPGSSTVQVFTHRFFCLAQLISRSSIIL